MGCGYGSYAARDFFGSINEMADHIRQISRGVSAAGSDGKRSA